MTDDEATVALARVHGHWPVPALDEAQALAWRTWMARWERSEFEFVLEACVAAGVSRRPVVADFQREVTQLRWRRRMEAPELTGGAPASREAALAGVEACRRALAEGRAEALRASPATARSATFAASVTGQGPGSPAQPANGAGGITTAAGGSAAVGGASSRGLDGGGV